ncbi:MAG: helix-turn-helix domain-containing protein [Anaerosomatales bacterium]
MTRLRDIGEALVAARAAQGLTQRELAAKLGVHQQQVARWERERYGCVSLSRLERVADVLGVAGEPLLAAETPAGYKAATVEAPDATAVTPVRDLGEIVARIRAHADELEERYGVTRIDVFGSFARGEQTAESDIDLIVEVAEPTLETVFGSERRLQEILGRETQAGSLRAINPRVRKNVEEDLVRVWPTQ